MELNKRIMAGEDIFVFARQHYIHFDNSTRAAVRNQIQAVFNDETSIKRLETMTIYQKEALLLLSEKLKVEIPGRILQPQFFKVENQTLDELKKLGSCMNALDYSF